MLLFPTTQEVTHIIRNRFQDPGVFIGRGILPDKDIRTAKILVDVVDAPTGMTRAHALGSDPKIIKGLGSRRREYRTGHWKETRRWNEQELLETRQVGTFSERAGRDLVNQGAVQLDNRLEVRKEWLRWEALINGVIEIDEDGVQYTVDFGVPASHKADLTDGGAGEVPWTNHADATPIKNLLEWINAFIGTGARADTMYYDQVVAQDLIQCAEIRDLLKQSSLVVNLNTGNLPQVLQMFVPQLKFVQYDQGYADDAGAYHFFVPDSHVVITGTGAPGEQLGDFASTISLHNGGVDKPQPGKFAILEDHSQKEKNPYIDLTVGQYGLPRLFHPNWIVSAKVANRNNNYVPQGNL